MARYAKEFNAGAFGSPMRQELEAHPHLLKQWGPDDLATVAVVRHLRSDSRRKDWTGRSYVLPGGASVATFVARAVGARVPDELEAVDFIYAYAEDQALTDALLGWRRARYATRISAASEVITCWGPRGSRHVEHPADQVTCALLPAEMMPQWPTVIRERVLGELASLHEWHDDYPFYSDGTWGAVNLRGFNPADPMWGVKPAEMPLAWQAAHPEARHFKCDWTVITGDTLATMRALVEDVPWWRSLERVRLMRMAGRPGGGKLGRHSDVTDRAAGTRDGQVARFHIPLATHPDITMTTWELDGTRRDTHLKPWHVYYLDQRKPHAVANPTDTDRVHLVADVIVDPEVRHRLEQLCT